LETPNGIVISVNTYNDLRNGQFDELVHFQKIPTPLQRKLWQDSEGGIEQDEKQLDKLKEKITSGDVPPAPVTADQIRNMIKESKCEDGVKSEDEVKGVKKKK
jgi:hypothetical protein